jgi:hypothetical protein
MMGRLVRKPRAAEVDAQDTGFDGILRSSDARMQTTAAEPGDGYLERLVKYVPGEVLAFFLVINAILDQAMKSGGPDAAMAGIPVPVIATGALLVAAALTPVFCWYVRRDGDAWIVNAVVSTIALPFWAYLMGAVAFANHHDGNLAAIMVMSFTVVSGLAAPKPDLPKLADQAADTAPRETPRLVNALAG